MVRSELLIVFSPFDFFLCRGIYVQPYLADGGFLVLAELYVVGTFLCPILLFSEDFFQNALRQVWITRGPMR